MRITGGQLGGRRIPVPKARLRPTQDRVREALFSMLAERVPGASFLDLFAGTGSVGLEAWSRGAERVCWVEGTRAVAATLARTLAALCGDEAELVTGDVFRVCPRLAGRGAFDIVFADPPYDFAADGSGGEGGRSSWARLFNIIHAAGLLAPDGLFIIETDRELAVPDGWRVLRQRSYGKTRLMVLSVGEEQQGEQE